MVSPSTKSVDGNIVTSTTTPITTTITTTNNNNNLIEMPTLSLKLANDLIMEMENFIKSDLAMLEKLYTTDYNDVPFERAINKAKRKFEKRRGPLLIKPLNKTKKKMIVGEMEYDPKSQIWKGNYSDLNAFPNPPALITNMGVKPDERVQLGNMKWDPNQKEWKGNEGDLTKFRFLKPALISQLTPNLDSRVENGMVYDPIAMKWKGNEDALDVFETMDDQNNDNTFTVGKEFNLTPSLIASFKKSSELHNQSLSGWFEKRDLNDRDYLYSIRSMSIVKLVRSAAYTGYSSSGGGKNNGTNNGTNGGGGGAQPSSPCGPGIIPLIPNKKKPVVDETKDWEDDIGFQGKPVLKLNLKIHHDAEDEREAMMSENWDKEMGFTSEEETLSSNNENGGQLSSSSQPHTPRKQVEEWSDFDNTMNSTITGKITQLNKKEGGGGGGSLNGTGNSSSLGNLINFSGGNINNTHKSSGEDDDDDFDWTGTNNNNTTIGLGNLSNINNNSGGGGSAGNSLKTKKGGSLKGVFIGNSGSIRPKKNTDKLKRGGTFGNIQSLAAAMANNSNTPLSSSSSTVAGGNLNEFYDDAFQVPNGSNVFTLKNKPHQDNFEMLLEDHGISSPKDEPCDETMRFFESEKDVVEEDWPDVRMPSDFAQKRSHESRKSPPIKSNMTVEDYSDELDIPKINQPLQLKKHTLIDNPFGDDDDDNNKDENDFDWDDVNFPENPSQLISSTSKLSKPIPLTSSVNNNNPTSTTSTTTTSTTTTTSSSTTASNINSNSSFNITHLQSNNTKSNINNINNTSNNNNNTFSTPSKINNIKPNNLTNNTISTPHQNNNNFNNFQTPNITPFRPVFTPKTLDEILKTPDDSPFKEKPKK